MEIRYTIGFDGTVNNNNPSLCGSTGLKLEEHSKSVGLDMGIGISSKEEDTGYIGGVVGYNSELGTERSQNGIFADASVKFKGRIEKTEVDSYGNTTKTPLKTGQNYSGEVGLRLDSGSVTSHTNISAFGEYNTFDDKKSTIMGGKYELSDGSKAMYAKAGIQEDEKGTSPYVGVGIRMLFGI